jgi:heat shock protein HtpX
MTVLWNNAKTVLLMGGLMGLCLALGYALGGPQAMVMAFVIGGAMNVVAFFYSDKIALATMRAQELRRQDDPILFEMVERLAERAKLPMPRVYLSAAEAPNAFATGRNPHHSAVCVTAGLRQMLSGHELEGVIAHELAHIKHRDVLICTLAAIVAGAISMLAHWALFWGGGSRRENPLTGLLVMIMTPIAALLIQMAISRGREYEADRLGADLAGSGRGLASALEKLHNASRKVPLKVPDAQANMFIVQPLTGSGMLKLFTTHPPVEKRIERLMAAS